MTFPLRRMAHEVRGKLAARYEALLATEAGDRARELEEHSRTSAVVSVNVKPGTMLAFLEHGGLRNAFERADDIAAATGQKVKDVLRSLLGRWHDERVSFERLCSGERHFHYGALNAGGLGAPRYGRYCLITGRRVDAAWEDQVFLSHDSLQPGTPFRGADGVLDERNLVDAAALPEDGGCLGALKHANDLAAGRLEVDRVCGDDGYIEALFLDTVTPDSVTAVRFSHANVRAIKQRALEGVGSGAAPTDDLDFELYSKIREGLTRARIDWEEVLA